MTLADQLRQAIRRSGESQLQIATAAGVSQSSLNRFMRGERQGISFDAAERLVAYLKLRLR